MVQVKPTIVFIPGAFHTTAVFHGIQSLLEGFGYPCVGRSPPSVTSSDPHNAGLETDVGFYRAELISPLLEDSKDIILILHSYGGASGGGAVQGFSKKERQRSGQEGSVLGLIYITAICLPVGMSVQENLGLGDEMVPWTDVDEKAGILTVNAPIAQFYNHLSTAEAEKWATQVVPQAIKSLKQKATYAASSDPAYSGKCAYLLCEDDQSFVLPVQQLWVQSSGITINKSLPTSHFPFLDKPNETVNAVLSFITEFTIDS